MSSLCPSSYFSQVPAHLPFFSFYFLCPLSPHLATLPPSNLSHPRYVRPIATPQLLQLFLFSNFIALLCHSPLCSLVCPFFSSCSPLPFPLLLSIYVLPCFCTRLLSLFHVISRVFLLGLAFPPLFFSPLFFFLTPPSPV